MIDTIRLLVTDYINQLDGYYTYDHTSRYTIIPGSGSSAQERCTNMVPSARSPIACSLPPSDCMHVPVLCVGTWRDTVHHPTIVFWDDKLIIRNGADELVSAIHYADPGLFDGLLTLALATAFIKGPPGSSATIYADFRGRKFVNPRTGVLDHFQTNANLTGRLPSQAMGTGRLSRAASRSTGL